MPSSEPANTPPPDTGTLSGKLVHAHKNYDPRIIVFYPVIALLLLTIIGGFAYQQLIKADEHAEREKLQSLRRILYPAPRGNILDRDGRLLVGNRARYAISINLDELRREFLREYRQVRKNYREADDKDIPTSDELWTITRGAVVQRYLDQVNDIIGREEKVNTHALRRHFNQQLLLPYTLLNDLTAAEFSRLSERLPVTSPLQLAATSVRYYPFGHAAAQTLGYIRTDDTLDAEDFPGDGLKTFKMRGTIGATGVEAAFDNHLQGKAGGVIYRVDPAGYRIEPPVERRSPVQGKDLAISLDIDLQLVCEAAMGASGSPDSYTGAVVALDVQTGEVLVLCSRPDFDLNDFSPRLSEQTHKRILEEGGYFHRAIQGLYAPGSTFKLITSIAAFRAGKLTDDTLFNCPGRLLVGNRSFYCHNRYGHHDIAFHDALSKSCNVFYYQLGLTLGPQPMADEARRFGLDQPTGIELPNEEKKRMIIPDPAWRRRARGDGWASGDTVTLAIGQNDLQVTPLGMACAIAAIARDELRTQPTLLHDPLRPPLRADPVSLTPEQRTALIEAMRETAKTGTGKYLTNTLRLTALDIAGKTGTAQKESSDGKGMLNIAWFVGFAPASNPRIAIAVLLEGDVAGEEFGGGAKAAPVAGRIFQKYFEKHPDRLPAR